MQRASHQAARPFDQNVAEIHHRTVGLGLDVTPALEGVIRVSREDLQAAEDVEEEGDEADVGVTAERDLLGFGGGLAEEEAERRGGWLGGGAARGEGSLGEAQFVSEAIHGDFDAASGVVDE